MKCLPNLLPIFNDSADTHIFLGVVTLLNKLGHCASNETMRRVDIGLERTLVFDNNIVPADLVLAPRLSLCFAWDNFDIQLETPSGHGTIHHTFGVCYQNKVGLAENSPQLVAPAQLDGYYGGKQRKVQRFVKVASAEEDPIAPYHKKPKMKWLTFETMHMFSPDSFPMANLLDTLWMMSVNSNQATPMWTGCNARRFNESSRTSSLVYEAHPLAVNER